MPHQACVNCHFFVKHSQLGEPATHIIGATEADRAKAAAGDYSWADHYTLGCQLSVWDEGYQPDRPRHELVTEVERSGYCFFWKHRPGMMFPAGETLQRREAETAEAKRDRRHVKWGLWIAAGALAIDVGLRLADALSVWPY